MTAEPSSCQHCGIPKRQHYQRWTEAVGWHSWVRPTDLQIRDRIIARRNARPRRRSR